ncbi:MAG: hypothetical protein NZZ41_03880 [Candidatus Dojkabacteria bacterium]|nr:hypothetical protein [Candidatus Dojkabacteria bacterium]
MYKNYIKNIISKHLYNERYFNKVSLDYYLGLKSPMSSFYPPKSNFLNSTKDNLDDISDFDEDNEQKSSMFTNEDEEILNKLMRAEKELKENGINYIYINRLDDNVNILVYDDQVPFVKYIMNKYGFRLKKEMKA